MVRLSILGFTSLSSYVKIFSHCPPESNQNSHKSGNQNHKKGEDKHNWRLLSIVFNYHFGIINTLLKGSQSLIMLLLSFEGSSPNNNQKAQNYGECCITEKHSCDCERVIHDQNKRSKKQPNRDEYTQISWATCTFFSYRLFLLQA